MMSILNELSQFLFNILNGVVYDRDAGLRGG
jgi:hypothetical protein